MGRVNGVIERNWRKERIDGIFPGWGPIFLPNRVISPGAEGFHRPIGGGGPVELVGMAYLALTTHLTFGLPSLFAGIVPRSCFALPARR